MQIAEDVQNTLIAQEKQMMAAFARGNSQAFAALALPEALMVTGGMRSSGAQYARETAQVRLKDFRMTDFTVLPLSADAVLLHYTLEVVDYPGPYDLSGVYLVSSVWVRREEGWRLIFNQDAQPPRV